MSDTAEMTDHAWAREHAAAFVADGLSTDESLRLEEHVRDCAPCAAVVEEARRLDRGLTALFAPVRPGPELEDFTILKLREGKGLSWRMVFPKRARRILIAAAVLIALGGIGALASAMPGSRRLPHPGGDFFARITGGEFATDPLVMNAKGQILPEDVGQSVEFSGLQSDFDAVRAAQTQRNLELLRQFQQESAKDDLKSDKGKAIKDLTESLEKQKTHALQTGESVATDGYTILKDGTVNGVVTGWKYVDPSAFALTNPQFDPTATGKFFKTTYANPYYEGQPTSWFRPGEYKFGMALGQPVQTGSSYQPPEPKKDPDDKKSTEPAKPAKPEQAVDPEPMGRRIIIRSGDIEFEVESFDSALATVTKLVTGIKGAFIGTVNSEKLPNGKVKGSITVRIPPESLDGLVLDLRRELGKGGELKGVKLASQDITKQYFDLESRLKAARTMETRLLQIIKEGKGEIKQLLEAEKELGVWRTKIEEFEGEIRYYSNMVALSTLTITLAEKEIRTAAGLTESERVQAGVEVEDVDKSYQQLLTAVVETKGRVTKSELKQLALGQFNASLQFEVSPDQAGPMRDRLRQLGRVARLEIDRVQSAEGAVTKETKAKRGDTVFVVQLYNVANVAPRETTVLSIAAVDVAAAYDALRNAVAKTTGRVHAAQLNEQDRQNLSAQLDFEVRRSEEAAIRKELEAVGEVIARQVTRASEGENVTDSKVLFRTAIVAANRLKPRELMAVSVQVADVEQAVSLVSSQAAQANARQVDSRINREPNGRVTAKLIYEVPLAAAASLAEQFKKTGTVREQQSVRDPSAPEGKFATARIDVTLKNEDKIVGDDAGVWPPVKRGLTYSASVLLTSLTWVVFGLCVVLPWAVIGYGGYRVVRWMGRPAGTTTMTV